MVDEDPRQPIEQRAVPSPDLAQAIERAAITHDEQVVVAVRLGVPHEAVHARRRKS